MSNALTRLSEAINGMDMAAHRDSEHSRRLFAYCREEASYWLRVLEAQEVESEHHVSPTANPNPNPAHHAG